MTRETPPKAAQPPVQAAPARPPKPEDAAALGAALEALAQKLITLAQSESTPAPDAHAAEAAALRAALLQAFGPEFDGSRGPPAPAEPSCKEVPPLQDEG